MRRAEQRPVLSRAAILLLLSQPLACPSQSAPTAASAEPMKSAAAPSASASGVASAAPAITHQPGTVPAPRKAAVAQADAGASAPPTFARLAAAKSRKGAAQAYSQVTFTGKGATLAIVGPSSIELLDPATGAGFAISQASPETFAVAADESLVAVAGGGATTLWDPAKGALLQTWPGSANFLEFSPDAKMLAATAESLVTVRDTATGKDRMRVTPDNNPFGAAFGAGGKELVVTGNNTQVGVFAIDGGAALPGGGSAETGATFGIALSPDGRFAAASAPAGHGLQVFDVHAWGPRTLVVVPEGACQEHVGPVFTRRLVLAYGGQRWVKGFEAGSWKPYASYHAPPGRELASAAADLSRVVVSREGGRDAVLITVGNGAETKLERAFADSATYAISDDAQHVASMSGNVVRVWSAKTGKVEYEEQP